MILASDTATVERAFELARSGECYSIEDIRRRLRQEQRVDVDNHLSGPAIKDRLHEQIALAERV